MSKTQSIAYIDINPVCIDANSAYIDNIPAYIDTIILNHFDMLYQPPKIINHKSGIFTSSRRHKNTNSSETTYL